MRGTPRWILLRIRASASLSVLILFELLPFWKPQLHYSPGCVEKLSKTVKPVRVLSLRQPACHAAHRLPAGAVEGPFGDV
jgi:hypothetical protein